MLMGSSVNMDHYLQDQENICQINEQFHEEKGNTLQLISCLAARHGVRKYLMNIR